MQTFHLPPDFEFQFGGPKEKALKNIATIKLLKQLEKDRREAAFDEQRILADYVGWGDKSVLDAASPSIEEVISEEEWASLRTSTLNAHYTELSFIHAVWNMLIHLGIGSRTPLTVLDPSAGTGHFRTCMPEALHEKTRWVEIEKDSLTARILRTLHPEQKMTSKIYAAGFEEIHLMKDWFDLAISNIPFGDYPVIGRSLRGPDQLVADDTQLLDNYNKQLAALVENEKNGWEYEERYIRPQRRLFLLDKELTNEGAEIKEAAGEPPLIQGIEITNEEEQSPEGAESPPHFADAVSDLISKTLRKQEGFIEIEDRPELPREAWIESHPDMSQVLAFVREAHAGMPVEPKKKWAKRMSLPPRCRKSSGARSNLPFWRKRAYPKTAAAALPEQAPRQSSQPANMEEWLSANAERIRSGRKNERRNSTKHVDQFSLF